MLQCFCSQISSCLRGIILQILDILAEAKRKSPGRDFLLGDLEMPQCVLMSPWKLRCHIWPGGRVSSERYSNRGHGHAQGCTSCKKALSKKLHSTPSHPNQQITLSVCSTEAWRIHRIYIFPAGSGNLQKESERKIRYNREVE